MDLYQPLNKQTQIPLEGHFPYRSVHFICLLLSTNVLIICTYLCGSKCFLRRYLPRCPPNHIPHTSSESIWILGAYQYIYALNICVHICVYTFISYYLCDIAWHGIILNYIKLYYITEFGMRKAARRSPCPQGRPRGPGPQGFPMKNPTNIWMIWGYPLVT